MRLPNGQEYYYLPRELYSVAALTDETGAIVEAATYDTYGKVAVYDGSAQAVEESPVGNPYYFTGRRLDLLPTASSPQPITKQLYHYRGREYDPGNGRFLQRDPLQIDLRFVRNQYIDGMNLYAYVRNQPIVGTDPTGFCCCFDRNHHFNRVCVTVANAKGTCKGTVTLFGREFPLTIDLADLKQITQDCDGCSTKCLPLPILVILPVERDIEHSGTLLGIQYSTTLHCRLTGGWLILWTCCKAA